MGQREREGAGSEHGAAELFWGRKTLSPSSKATSLNLSRHLIFQNGNINGKQSFEDGLSSLGSGTADHPDNPG